MTGEEAGRKARYDAFYQVASEIAAASGEMRKQCRAFQNIKIAVAQNANDQAETVLFRLLRGTGTDGLAGIAYRRMEREFEVIRPLLDVYRSEIEQYCQEQGLKPMQDHTNQEPIYARNRIRLQLLPYLEQEYGDNVKERLVRLAQIAADDKEYFWAETEREFRRLAEPLPECRSSESEQRSGAADQADEDWAAVNRAATAQTDPNNAPNPQITYREDCELGVAFDRKALAALAPSIRHRLIMRAFAEIGLENDISHERLMAADRLIQNGTGGKIQEFPHGYRMQIKKQKVRFFCVEKSVRKK